MAFAFRRDGFRLFSSSSTISSLNSNSRSAFFSQSRLASQASPSGPAASFVTSAVRRSASSLEDNKSSTQSQTTGADGDDLEVASSSLTLDSSDEFVKLAQDFDPSYQTGENQYIDPSSAPEVPKYYRGPLNPVQPPSKTDPQSREFIPGPFTYPRLLQTYESTVAPDILTLLYQHDPAGLDAKTPIDQLNRLRRWEGESPYYANRPARKPRGAAGLDLVRHPIRYNHIPHLEKVIVHSMVKQALKSKPYFDVASMVIQSITNVRCDVHKSKKNIIEWDLRPGKLISVTAELTGEDMYHFLSKIFDVVLPRIKDWPGVSPKSGDRSGNLSFGLTPSAVALFPEIETNYDSYPTEMIPGCHITIQTSARTDRDARLLLSGLGMPFSGPLERSRV